MKLVTDPKALTRMVSRAIDRYRSYRWCVAWASTFPLFDKLVDQHGGKYLGYRTDSIFRLGRLVAAEAALVDKPAVRGNSQASFRKVVIRKVGEQAV